MHAPSGSGAVIPPESPMLVIGMAHLSRESATVTHELTRLTAQSDRSEPHSQLMLRALIDRRIMLRP